MLNKSLLIILVFIVLFDCPPKAKAVDPDLLNGEYWFGSVSIDVSTHVPLAKRGTVVISGNNWSQVWDDEDGHHTFNSTFTTSVQLDGTVNIDFPGRTYNVAWNGDLMIHANSTPDTDNRRGFDIIIRKATNVNVNDILGEHSYFGHHLESPSPGDSCGSGNIIFDPNGTATGTWTNNQGTIESVTVDWTLDGENATITVYGPEINELGYATIFLGDGGIACSWQIVPEEGWDDLGYAVFIKKTNQTITPAEIADKYHVRFLETGPGAVPYTCSQGTCLVKSNETMHVDAWYSSGEHDVFDADYTIGSGNKFSESTSAEEGIISPDLDLIFIPEYICSDPRYSYNWIGGIFLIRSASNVTDLNDDMLVNFSDYITFAAQWRNEGTDLYGDFDGNNQVDTLDLKVLADSWLWQVTWF